MDRLMISATRNDLANSLELSKVYGVSLELTDFAQPDILRDDKAFNEAVSFFAASSLPGGVTLHGAFFDINVASVDPDIALISESRVKKSLEATERLGARAVVFHTGITPQLISEAYIGNWLAKSERFWSGMLAEHRGVDIYIENMFDDRPEPLLKLSESLCRHPNYGVCLDYAHATVYAKDAPGWLRVFSRYIRHIHINDNNGTEDSHLPLGDGVIDWKLFFALRRELTPEASVLLEISSAKNCEKSLVYMTDNGYLDGRAG